MIELQHSYSHKIFQVMVLILCSVGVVLPKSLCHFRFTTVVDSNLAMSKTIFILISADTDILSETHRTKL